LMSTKVTPPELAERLPRTSLLPMLPGVSQLGTQSTIVKTPEFKRKIGRRGVLRNWQADSDDPTEDPQFGRVGKRIENTGPLTIRPRERRKRSSTMARFNLRDRHGRAGKPFFCWIKLTRMHVFTRLKKEAQGGGGVGYLPGRHGRADNTIVMWSTDKALRH